MKHRSVSECKICLCQCSMLSCQIKKQYSPANNKQPVNNKIAMTGELTLRGKVLPVGGIKEKILAAKRSGINEIISSKQNKKDILEINERYVKGMKFHYVNKMKDVTDISLIKQKVSNPIEFN